MREKCPSYQLQALGTTDSFCEANSIYWWESVEGSEDDNKKLKSSGDPVQHIPFQTCDSHCPDCTSY